MFASYIVLNIVNYSSTVLVCFIIQIKHMYIDNWEAKIIYSFFHFCSKCNNDNQTNYTIPSRFSTPLCSS